MEHLTDTPKDKQPRSEAIVKAYKKYYEKTRAAHIERALKCGHSFHSRCFREWCGTKNCINCPLCGDVEETKHNRFCSFCKKWGHSGLFEGCPKVNEDIDKMRQEQKTK